MSTLLVQTVLRDEQKNRGNLSDKEKIENFVASQVIQRGLDERTAKAYEFDLRQVYLWLEEKQILVLEENTAEGYLEYLIKEKKRKPSTVIRKYRVLQYYLEYLSRQGYLASHRTITPPAAKVETSKEDHGLSKQEIDAFFTAMDREYENLDSEFRKRVCLRDNVMMELLFFHEVEISELLKLKVADYDMKSGVLTIYGKREKHRKEQLFSGELIEKLKLWIDEHEYFEKGNEYDDYLFLSKVGKALSMKMVILIFDKYRVMAGIEKECTPKDLKCGMKEYARELLVERCRQEEELF